MGDGDAFFVTAAVQRDFDADGYVLVRGLLTELEVARMRECAEGSEDIARHSYGRADGQGRSSRLCIWNYAGDDVLGVAARLEF